MTNKELFDQIIGHIDNAMTTSDIHEIQYTKGKIGHSKLDSVLTMLKQELTSYNFRYNAGYLSNGNVLIWKNKATEYVKENFVFDPVF